MIGIGLFPFILLPWLFVGPVVWGVVAIYMWSRARQLAYVSGCATAVSVAVPLVGWLARSGLDAIFAGMVIAIPSFFVFLLLAIALGLMRIKSALTQKP